MKPRPLSPSQLKALRNIAAGRPSNFGLSGRSEHGAHFQTLVSLWKRDLVTDDFTLSDAGREALK